MPAVKAPSSMSRSSTMLSATSAARMTKHHPDRELPGGVQRGAHERVHRAARHPEGEPDRERRRTPAKRASTTVDRPGSRPPRKIEIAMSGPNSPTAPIARDGLAERRRQLAGVPEDRQERAERRRAQRDADHDRRLPRREQEARRDTRGEADEPPERRAAAEAAAERAELDLGARDEEEHREPELRERVDELARHAPSRARPDRPGCRAASSNTTMGTRIHRPSPRASSGASTARIGITSSVGSRSSTRTD